VGDGVCLQLCEPRDCAISSTFGVCYFTDRAGVYAIDMRTRVVRLITGGGWGRDAVRRMGSSHTGTQSHFLGSSQVLQPGDTRDVGYFDGPLRVALFDHPDGIEFDEDSAMLYVKRCPGQVPVWISCAAHPVCLPLHQCVSPKLLSPTALLVQIRGGHSKPPHSPGGCPLLRAAFHVVFLP